MNEEYVTNEQVLAAISALYARIEQEQDQRGAHMDSLFARLVRIETRLCKLMEDMGVEP